MSSFFTGNYDALFEVGSTGKSGSLFFYTADKKYMMKTLPEREFDSFKEVLPNYYKMLKNNPQSLITRFYGLHRMRWYDVNKSL
jgi:1-phosphatidylinositol-4-phosphate 5-kinase